MDNNLSILNRLKSMSTIALKNKDTALRVKANTAQSDLLSLIEEVRLKMKKDVKAPATKDEELAAINSLINRLSKGTTSPNGEVIIAEDVQEYLSFLRQFQPLQLTFDEIKKIVIDNSFTSMKEAMPYFSREYKNRFSAGELNKVINSL